MVLGVSIVDTISDDPQLKIAVEIANGIHDIEENITATNVARHSVMVYILQYETLLEPNGAIVGVLERLLQNGWCFKTVYAGVSILRIACQYKDELPSYKKFYYEFRFHLHKFHSSKKVESILIGLGPGDGVNLILAGHLLGNQ